MTDRYPYRHHGPAVHGSKLADYLISEANMIEDLEQLRAENVWLRETTEKLITALDKIEQQADYGQVDACQRIASAALSADPAPVVGVTVREIVHHIHRLVGAGDDLDGWMNPEGIRARGKWDKVKLDALRAIAGENGNENG